MYELMCLLAGVLLAFVSFRENYTSDVIPSQQPNIYLSTLVMRPEARGKHLTVDILQSAKLL